MDLETISYPPWTRCLRLASEHLELVAALDFGPRILHCSFPGEENQFALLPAAATETAFGTWRIYGGHRLWAAPERSPETYHPDNSPVAWEAIPGGVRLIGQPEPGTGLQKEIEVSLDAGAPAARVLHRIRNLSGAAVTLAPWALSVMAPGGTAILPLLPTGADPVAMLPTHTVSLWPYSDPSDARWSWGRDTLYLRQDPQRTAPQKVGVTGQAGWAAYVRGETAFVKRYTFIPGALYPDQGVSLEAYTDHRFLEVETLGPLQSLAPGEAVEHLEEWQLVRPWVSP